MAKDQNQKQKVSFYTILKDYVTLGTKPIKTYGAGNFVVGETKDGKMVVLPGSVISKKLLKKKGDHFECTVQENDQLAREISDVLINATENWVTTKPIIVAAGAYANYLLTGKQPANNIVITIPAKQGSNA